MLGILTEHRINQPKSGDGSKKKCSFPTPLCQGVKKYSELTHIVQKLTHPFMFFITFFPPVTHTSSEKAFF